MIHFIIKDNNDNIIYEKKDDSNDLIDLELSKIVDILEKSDNNVNLSLNFENTDDNSLYHHTINYDSCGYDKDGIIDSLMSILEFYNDGLDCRVPVSQLGRLSAHDDSLARSSRCSSGFDDSLARSSHYSDEHADVSDMLKEVLSRHRGYDFEEYDKHNPFYRPRPWETLQRNCCDDVDEPDEYRNMYGHYTVTDQEWRDKIDEIIKNAHGRNRSKQTSENVEPVQEWSLSDTTQRAIQDFIGYLRTQDTWATLLDELKFYHDPDDNTGKQQLIDKFCEHMRQKENQELKENREKTQKP